VDGFGTAGTAAGFCSTSTFDCTVEGKAGG
jgi:hypothetical protein